MYGIIILIELHWNPSTMRTRTTFWHSTNHSYKNNTAGYVQCEWQHTYSGDWEVHPAFQHTHKYYRIAENFRGRKLLRISRFCGYLWKFSPQNWGAWCPLAQQKRAIRESFLHENRIFHQFAKVFSLESFPLYVITARAQCRGRESPLQTSTHQQILRPHTDLYPPTFQYETSYSSDTVADKYKYLHHSSHTVHGW